MSTRTQPTTDKPNKTKTKAGPRERQLLNQRVYHLRKHLGTLSHLETEAGTPDNELDAVVNETGCYVFDLEKQDWHRLERNSKNIYTYTAPGEEPTTALYAVKKGIETMWELTNNHFTTFRARQSA